ncbi:MAG: hypothetical protein ACKO7U_00445, partial [Actinomycetota bacterium]
MVASRRRSGPYRRRRWTAALVAVGLVAALAAAAWSARGPDGPEARAQGAAPATTGVEPETTPATTGSTGETGEDPTGIAEASAPDVPKRLGSGQPVTFAFGGDVM